jgi:membrane-bound metal-dependent hydrolase YbcI (DUF457 family)
MATPVGHLLAGALIGAAYPAGPEVRRSAAAGALCAIAADLDFIPGGLMMQPARFHHAESHSLLFALAAGALAGLLARQGRWRWGVLTGMAYASHLLLDWVTFDDGPPIGMPLLWPLSGSLFQAPWTIFPDVRHSSGVPWSAHNFGVVALEIALLGPPLAWLVARAWRRRPIRGEAA